MRIVVDTNVLVSAVFAGGRPHQLLQQCIQGRHRLLASAQTLQEFVDVIRRPKFGFTEDQVHEALGAVVGIADIVEVRKRHKVIIADPADDMFLDAAVAGRAEFIVSGDRHLLDLQEFQGVPIVTVAQFLTLEP